MAIVIISNELKFIKGHLNMIKTQENTSFKIQGATINQSEASLNVKFKKDFLESPKVNLKTSELKKEIPEIKNLEDLI